MLPNDRPYTIARLAERWECSQSHVKQLIHTGRLNAWKLGEKLWRINADEVERFESKRD